MRSSRELCRRATQTLTYASEARVRGAHAAMPARSLQALAGRAKKTPLSTRRASGASGCADS
eukprot:6177725-Pleurochrysis_carterae.AAC.5